MGRSHYGPLVERTMGSLEARNGRYIHRTTLDHEFHVIMHNTFGVTSDLVRGARMALKANDVNTYR